MVAMISPAAPVAAPSRANAPAPRVTPPAPQLMRRCDGPCSCGGSCHGPDEAGRDDQLATLLQRSVQQRTLQRTPAIAGTQPEPPPLATGGPLLQRRCSRTRLRNLQRDMHAACDSGISCRGNFSCDELDDRYNNGIDCVELREQIQSECYDNRTDSGHAEAIDSVNAAIDFCERKLDLQDC